MPNESPPVLLGIDQIFLSITNALTFYGRAVVSGGFTKLTFEQTPDVAADFEPDGATRWASSVTMRCFEEPQVDDWVDPLYEKTWSAAGDTFFDAMECLANQIENDLKGRQEAMSMAMVALGLPDPASVWTSEDPPAEDDPVVEDPGIEVTG